MRIIEIKLYQFGELSENAKGMAIMEHRAYIGEYGDVAECAIDNCYLLEPKDEELKKLFGKNFDKQIIENNRKVYFDLGRDKHIDISKAMEIQDSEKFLMWLGLSKRLIDKCDYDILADAIEFSCQSHNEFTDIENKKLDKAREKFAAHCQNILKRIEEEIDYRYSDEAIIEEIEANEYEFTESGKKYYER